MTTIEVICPSVLELMERPQRNVPCTVEGCDKLLATTAALKMHVIKRHGIYKNKSERIMFSKHPQSKGSVLQKQYFCPVEGCSRHKMGKNPFSNMWPLKQHYQQVHGERNHFCSKCNFPFAFELQRRKHEKTCGRILQCSCGVPFTTPQALSMHAMRKKHRLLPSTTDPDETTEKQTLQKQKESSAPLPKAKKTPKNRNPLSVAVNRILTIPVPSTNASSIPHLLLMPKPVQVTSTSSTVSSKLPPKNQSKTQRFLLPKPNMLSVGRAAVLHPKASQIVTIKNGVVKSFPVSAPPQRQPSGKQKVARTSRNPKNIGCGGDRRNSYLQGCMGPGFVLDDCNNQLNNGNNCQTQTNVQQNSAHTQTSSDILREAFISAHINSPTGKQQQLQVFESEQQPQEQQHIQNQQLPQSTSSFHRHTQTVQASYRAAQDCQPSRPHSINPVSFEQSPFKVQTQSQVISANATSTCDVQTDSWLSSLIEVSDQGTITDTAGVPCQTDLSLLDFLELSHSETQTVISHLQEVTSTETISTQTSSYLGNNTQTETSIQTTVSQIKDPNLIRITPQSTMQTQTNVYSAYFNNFAELDKSQSQLASGVRLPEDISSTCRQTQTLAPAFSTIPQTDHQQTQTSVPNFNLSSSDFLCLDMYTQTMQQGRGNGNSSLKTQTESLLDYSLSSMQTQTMADFDLGAFDYQSTSVQTDAQFLQNQDCQLTSRAQVQTQTNSSLEFGGGDTLARHVQTEASKLYAPQLGSSALTDSHTQTG